MRPVPEGEPIFEKAILEKSEKRASLIILLSQSIVLMGGVHFLAADNALFGIIPLAIFTYSLPTLVNIYYGAMFGKIAVWKNCVELPRTMHEMIFSRKLRRYYFDDIKAIYPEYEYSYGTIRVRKLFISYRNDHNYSINEEFVFDTFHALEKAFGERWSDIFVDNYDLHHFKGWRGVRTWFLRDEDRYVKRCIIFGTTSSFFFGLLLVVTNGEFPIIDTIFILTGMPFMGFVPTILLLMFHFRKKTRAVAIVYRCINCDLSFLVPIDILGAYHKNYDEFRNGYASFEPKGMYRFLVDDFRENNPSGTQTH